ncbi:DUF2827 family protein [Burkholderia gladioli]|uniref:DUF2827 family protein n=1 Tax=Burkholderia gladioli TaxID=28095 RepID=UPI0030CC26D7
MKIGISVLTHAGQSFWENGLGQNVLFLARVFSNLPFVQEVILLNSGDQDTLPPEAEPGQPFRLLRPRDTTELVDVVIEMAGGLDVEWLDYMRARGAKVVYHCCGQPYVSLIEPIIFDRQGYAARTERCDALWILPKDRRFKPMLEALHRCPVLEAPYIWSPEFIDRRVAQLAQHGLTFGYQSPAPGAVRQPLAVAIFEPNVSVVKSCVLPMLICDNAFRADPEAISSMFVLNSAHMTNHASFNYLANSLDIVKAGRASFDARHDFPAFMAQHANAVVSHQWNNDQNTLYLDALYGGYPLIHNSAWLGDQAGYYYPHFDAPAGTNQLVWAAYHHYEHLEDYQRKARRFLSQLAPEAADNANAYARLLLQLRTAQKETA